MNRANRIKEIARVGDENKMILGRLQSTRSNYNADDWLKEYKNYKKIG